MQNFYYNHHDDIYKVFYLYEYVYYIIGVIIYSNRSRKIIIIYLWRAKEELSLKFFLQSSNSQTWGLSPEWVLVCTFNAERWIKLFPQPNSWHTYGLSFVWIRRCLAKSERRPTCIKYSVSCYLTCWIIIIYFLPNALWQLVTVHWCGFDWFCWVSIWMSSRISIVFV